MLLAVLTTLLGAAVIAIAILASVIQNRDETIRGLREKGEGATATHPLYYFAARGGILPIVASSRKSLMGPGYVLTIRNECTESIPLVLALSNPQGGRHKSVNIVVEAMQTAEFGHFDNWKLSGGDAVEISHEGFSSVTMRFR
ncbi:MAG TPA: hypothetical protein VKG78_09975 [Opitutaceae bacterium]|nr:hypothetical protein [Opitutaceae bacterium]